MAQESELPAFSFSEERLFLDWTAANQVVLPQGIDSFLNTNRVELRDVT